MSPQQPGGRRLKPHRSPRRSPAAGFVLGIDTGGTYTDAVLMDDRTRDVLCTAKSLTTRDDLARGILDVLENIHIDDPASVRLVGISSTLATNSIAEGKGRRVGLILIGYDERLLQGFNLEAKLSTPIFSYFGGGHTSQGVEQAPVDLQGISEWVSRHHSEVDAVAISSYFSPLDPSHELQARDVVRRIASLPVVLGHQLSTRLDSIKRAATATLNAGLVAIMDEFVSAVRRALSEREIDAPLMIVKGDGSLMPYTEAVLKPVETVLSGPAASAVGGHFLSALRSALMIDVGGTTTDMALFEDSRLRVSDKGAHVGEVETAVQSACIRTLCVGCDSRVTFGPRGAVQIGPDRVVPVCRLASRFPTVSDSLRRLTRRPAGTWKKSDFEFWFTVTSGSPPGSVDLSPAHGKLVDLLSQGPMAVSEVLSRLDVHHPVQLGAQELIKQGCIEVATLTPTDILHATGKLDIWDSSAASQCLETMCMYFRRDASNAANDVFEHISSVIAEEVFIFLARATAGDSLPDHVDGTWMRWLMDEAMDGTHPLLSVNLRSRYPIIGIGAPAQVFLEAVARKLNARLVLPEHHPVANAAGAVAGSLVVSKEAILHVQENGRHAQLPRPGRLRSPGFPPPGESRLLGTTDYWKHWPGRLFKTPAEGIPFWCGTNARKEPFTGSPHGLWGRPCAGEKTARACSNSLHHPCHGTGCQGRDNRKDSQEVRSPCLSRIKERLMPERATSRAPCPTGRSAPGHLRLTLMPMGRRIPVAARRNRPGGVEALRYRGRSALQRFGEMRKVCCLGRPARQGPGDPPRPHIPRRGETGPQTRLPAEAHGRCHCEDGPRPGRGVPDSRGKHVQGRANRTRGVMGIFVHGLRSV